VTLDREQILDELARVFARAAVDAFWESINGHKDCDCADFSLPGEKSVFSLEAEE